MTLKIKELDAKFSLQAQKYSADIPGGMHPTLDDMIAQKDEILKEIERLEKQCVDIQKEFLTFRLKSDNQLYIDVLEYYYFNAMSIRAIAKKISYSERHTRRLLKQALDYVRQCPTMSA